MKRLDQLGRLLSMLGITGTLRFCVAYLKAKRTPPTSERLAIVPIGPYRCFFPNIHDFAGLFAEIFLNDTYRLPATPERLRIFDCGANIGISLIYFKLRAPHATITCFEPNPAARAVLAKNITENGWNDVIIVPNALGKIAGSGTLFVKRTDATGSDASVADYLETKGYATTSVSIEVGTLSSYLDEPVDLLKIDIEGPELDVLEETHAKGSLARVKAIQLEYHFIPGHFTRPLSDLTNLLEGAGFRTESRPLGGAAKAARTDLSHAWMVYADRN